MTEEEIMFERLFAPIKAKIQDKNKNITYLKKENARLREYAKFLQDTYCEIDRELAELKKENAELKKELQDYQFNYDNIKELTNENAELNRDKTELVNSVTELESKVTELNKQVEKLKNCANCKNFKGLWCKYKLKRKPTPIPEEYREFFCICHDKWELAK